LTEPPLGATLGLAGMGTVFLIAASIGAAVVIGWLLLRFLRSSDGRTAAARRDPVSPGDAAIDLALQPGETTAPEAGPAKEGHVTGTGATFECPLWLHGLRDAETWLLPPRSAGGLRLVVVDFPDPHGDEGPKEREWIVDSAAFLIAEDLWMQTDLQADPAVFVNVEARKLLQMTSPIGSFEDLAPFIGSIKPEPAVAWGTAGRDLQTEGLTATLRLPGESSERTISAPLADLAETIRSFLAGRGLCRVLGAPPWYRSPDPLMLPIYAVLLHNLQLQILADQKNRVLPPLTPDLQRDMVDFAFDALTEYPLGGEHLKLIAATTALYARRAGRLDEEARKRVLGILQNVTDPHDPLYRLSPHLYAVFDEPVLARKRRESLLPSAEGRYADWLGKLEGES
jgi:hypothetical protein